MERSWGERVRGSVCLKRGNLATVWFLGRWGEREDEEEVEEDVIVTKVATAATKHTEENTLTLTSNYSKPHSAIARRLETHWL